MFPLPQPPPDPPFEPAFPLPAPYPPPVEVKVSNEELLPDVPLFAVEPELAAPPAPTTIVYACAVTACEIPAR